MNFGRRIKTPVVQNPSTALPPPAQSPEVTPPAPKRKRLADTFKKPLTLFKRKTSNETCERALAAPALASLIGRFGSPPHTAWLDDNYQLFTAPNIEGAVGYRKQMGCAVVFGEPLAAPEQQMLLAEAFEQFCNKKKLKPIFCAVRENFARAVTAGRGGLVEFGTEDILEPATNKTSKGIKSSINKAKKERVDICEYERDIRHPDGVRIVEYEREARPDNTIEAQFSSVVQEWLKNRTGQQMFGSHVSPFAVTSGSRWLYAQRDNKIIGFITLAHLQAQNGFTIEHCIVDPSAPEGTTEWLIDSSIGKLRERGITYQSFGVTAANELGEMVGFSETNVGLAKSIYKKVDGYMHFDGKRNFHRKFGVKRRESLFIAFPKGAGFTEMAGVVLAFNGTL